MRMVGIERAGGAGLPRAHGRGQAQERVAADREPVRLAHGDAVQMRVGDHVVLDRDVAIEHLVAGAALVHLLVAHEDRLGGVPAARVQHIAADRHVGARPVGLVGPELDHVGVVARLGRAVELPDLVALDQRALDRHEVEPVRADLLDAVAHHREVVDLAQHGSAEPVVEEGAADLEALGPAREEPRAGGVSVVGGVPGAGGDVAVEGRVQDGDVRAPDDLERARAGGPRAGLVGVVEHEAFEAQVRDVLEHHAREPRGVGGLGRSQRDGGRGRQPRERQHAVIAGCERNRLAAAGAAQRVAQTGGVMHREVGGGRGGCAARTGAVHRREGCGERRGRQRERQKHDEETGASSECGHGRLLRVASGAWAKRARPQAPQTTRMGRHRGAGGSARGRLHGGAGWSLIAAEPRPLMHRRARRRTQGRGTRARRGSTEP